MKFANQYIKLFLGESHEFYFKLWKYFVPLYGVKNSKFLLERIKGVVEVYNDENLAYARAKGREIAKLNRWINKPKLTTMKEEGNI